MESASDLDTAQLLERVQTDLAELASRGTSFRDSDDLLAVVVAAPHIRSQVDCLAATSAAEMDRWSIAADFGYRTVAQLVGDRTGADPKQTRADIRLGRWIDDFELLGKSFGAGEILTCHVEHLRRSIHNPRTRQDLIDDQELFTKFAADLDFPDFEAACLYWKNANDPDGAEPKEQIASTYVRAHKRGDGCVKIDGLLDPLMGDQFMTMWEHENQKLFRSDQDNDDTLGAFNQLDPRGTGRRGARALIALMTRGFARADGTFPIPLINAVASHALIEELLKRIAQPTDDPLPLAFGDIDKRCELIDGTPLHPAYLLATLGLATFRRQILTAAGRSIDVSVNARCFTPWQKQALLVEARGQCTSPGCDAPFSWLHGDHTQPHSKDGPTLLANGNIKCGPDNLAKGNRPEIPAA